METFQESRDVLNQCLAKFWSQPFSLAVLLGVSPLREAVFGVPPLRCRGFPSLRETLLVQIPRETLLNKSRSVTKFCDILSIHCFQPACVVLVCFSSLPWSRCLCTHPHDVSSHLVRALDHLSFFWLRVFVILIVIDISDIQRASRVSSCGSIHSH